VKRLEKVVGAGASCNTPAPHQDSVRGYDLVSSTAQQGHLKWEPAFAVVADWANPKSPSRNLTHRISSLFFPASKEPREAARKAREARAEVPPVLVSSPRLARSRYSSTFTDYCGKQWVALVKYRFL